MNDRTRTRGVSLIELLVAVAILAVALTPLLAVFVQSVKTAEHSHKKTLALNLLRDMQEEIRSKDFVDNQFTVVGGVGPKGGPATFGLETGDGYSATAAQGRQLLDDIDDYNGWCRGKECQCGGTGDDTGVSANGLCDDNSSLESYRREYYTGPGYTRYDGFTRRVQVYNIWSNVSSVQNIAQRGGGRQPWTHYMAVGMNSAKDKPFKFYDLRDQNFANLTTGARGRTDLKIVRVTVTYRGPVTPAINLQEAMVLALPISRQGN